MEELVDRSSLVKYNVQWGGPKHRWNPSMKPYIFRENKPSKSYTLNLEEIIKSCQGINNYITSLLKKKKTILFVSTEERLGEVVKKQAMDCGMPYIVNKWKGGFLTNFQEIEKNLKKLQRLNHFLNNPNSKKITKQEQSIITKERDKLQKIYEGVSDLKEIPDALFIVGLNKEKTALKEAKKVNIPVIAICNSDCDPKSVDYFIIGNDRNSESVDLLSGLVAESIKKNINY